jgi:hypothetical protein
MLSRAFVARPKRPECTTLLPFERPAGYGGISPLRDISRGEYLTP